MMGLHSWVFAAALAATPAHPAPAAPAAEGEVVAVSLVPAPGRAELIISTRGAVRVRDFILTDPHRAVFDIAGATLTTAAVPIYDGVTRAGILNVRVRQYERDVVRVVVELDRPRPYQVHRDEDGVHVSFGADESFLAWSTGVPAVPGRRTADPPARAAEPMAEAPAPSVAGRLPQQQRAEPRITASWDGASIADVVSGFAALSGRTIVLGKGVTGTVTAEIRDKPWSNAFQAILAAQGLSAQEMPGGIIRVDDPAQLAAIDSLEPLETRVLRVNYARAVELANSVKGIMTKNRGEVTVDTASNSLILTDTKTRIAAVEDFARGLDIRTPQVSIQAKIIFVDRSDIEQLGFKYDLGSPTQFFNRLVQRPDPFSETPGETYLPTTNIVDLGGNQVSSIANAEQTIQGSALDLVFSTALGGFTLTTFLSALERVELSDIQAEPVITTLDNKEADILVGEEVPVRVIDASSGTGGGQPPRATVQFKETGIRLTVTPHVTNNRQILMRLRTERSAVKPLASADLGFSIDKQQTTNQLLVNDGETAVIGGLTVTSVNRARNGIPLLSSLPLIGGLFSFTENRENRKDLIILVTPRIVDDGTDIRR